MKRNTLALSALCLLSCGSLLAAPAAKPPPPAPAALNPLPNLLSGKSYPTSLKRDQFTADFHLVDLIDAQGQPATFATRGETMTLGGEVFLVAYLIPPPPKPAGQPPVTPPAPTTFLLTLVNMRHVQALGGIRDLPAPDSAPKEAGTP